MYRENLGETRFQRLMHASWPLFTAFRVDVRVSWWSIFVPVLFYAALTGATWAGFELAAALWSLVLSVALYASIWTHEMGHIAAGRRFGVDTQLITLSPLGGLAHMQAPMPNPRADVLVSLAGPAVQALWAGGLAVGWFVLHTVNYAPTDGLPAYLEVPAWIPIYRDFMWLQISLTAFNLLPCFPMDGGRALRGLLARRMHANRASMITAYTGMAGSIVLFLVAMFALFAPERYVVVGSWFAPVLASIAIGNFLACRGLLAEIQHVASVYEPVEAWKRGAAANYDEPVRQSLAESERISRAEERREKRAAEDRRREESGRRKIQERVDQLLDRINEVGGVGNLSAAERRELADASELLRRETAER